MSVTDLITGLATRGIRLVARADRLLYHPAERLTPGDLAALRQHKQALLRMLRSEGHTWPIIPGREHFSLYQADPCGPWPEFIPGFHFDIRQPSRIRGMSEPPTNP